MKMNHNGSVNWNVTEAKLGLLYTNTYKNIIYIKIMYVYIYTHMCVYIYICIYIYYILYIIYYIICIIFIYIKYRGHTVNRGGQQPYPRLF